MTELETLIAELKRLSGLQLVSSAGWIVTDKVVVMRKISDLNRKLYSK